MDISFPFSRTCLPLLGFPFGITLPLPFLLHNDPFLLEHPHPPTPLAAETTLGNDSNNGFDMLVQSRDIPGISSNYFLIVSFLLLLFSLYMKNATMHLPGGGLWCRQEVPFCVISHIKRHFVVILRYDPNDSHCLQSTIGDRLLEIHSR